MENGEQNMKDDKKKISIVVSVYNEELSLNSFYSTTVNILETILWDYELIFVNDGSTDHSIDLLREFARHNPKVKVINFVKNFGHEAAMIAGIDYAAGDGIVCMDADLQHPPECIPDIIQKFEDGYEVILMIRTKNEEAGLVKKLTSAIFYKAINVISPVKFERNASDFFAIARPAAEVLRHDYREKVRYLRGYVQSIGFRKTTIEYEARNREAGKSKYNLKKLLEFSINAMCSFSDLPLKLGIYSGCIVALFGVILMIYTIINKFVNDVPSGYSTIVVALCFLFSVNLIVIGIIGEYIAILFTEIKDRPIYIVRDVQNGEGITESVYGKQRKSNISV
jgi:dolichol-phosphate mannosyltransferase